MSKHLTEEQKAELEALCSNPENITPQMMMLVYAGPQYYSNSANIAAGMFFAANAPKRFCPACGTPASDTANYCTECGTKLDGSVK